MHIILRYKWEIFYCNCTYNTHIPQCDFGKRTPREELREIVCITFTCTSIWVNKKQEKNIAIILSCCCTFLQRHQNMEKKERNIHGLRQKAAKSDGRGEGECEIVLCVFSHFFGEQNGEGFFAILSSYALFDYIQLSVTQSLQNCKEQNFSTFIT